MIRVVLGHEEDLINPEYKILRDLETLIGLEYRNHRPAIFYQQSLGLSSSHLADLIRYYFGCTLHDLLTDKLMNAAAFYLTTTRMSIKWITYELGFQDPAYFTRWFTKLTGLNPRAYRKANFLLKVVQVPDRRVVDPCNAVLS